jgi:hypothetical protein
MENQTQEPITQEPSINFIFQNTDGTNGKDFDEIVEYFKNEPDFRILEYVDRFWIEVKIPNVQAEYLTLSQCRRYEPIKDIYLRDNGYYTLDEAEQAYLSYRTLPVVHSVPSIE